MSQENVELTRQAYDAFNRRDLDAFLELMDADVVLYPRQAAMQGGNHGHAGVRQWWRDLLDVFPDIAIEVICVRDLGNLTLASLRLFGHGADSESPFDERVWVISEVRDGKGVWSRVYSTEDDALEAAGLSE